MLAPKLSGISNWLSVCTISYSTDLNQFTKQKRRLIMRHNKFFTSAIVVCIIAFFTTGWAPSPTPAATPTPVTITGIYDFSTFPFVWGTFTTSGALTISGTTSMDVVPNQNGKIFHCEIVLYEADGTITIHQECQSATSPWKGRWEIVSGTGAYENLRGNGLVLMPPNTEEMTGVIF